MTQEEREKLAEDIVGLIAGEDGKEVRPALLIVFSESGSAIIKEFITIGPMDVRQYVVAAWQLEQFASHSSGDLWKRAEEEKKRKDSGGTPFFFIPPARGLN